MAAANEPGARNTERHFTVVRADRNDTRPPLGTDLPEFLNQSE
jgi:hypothetical protein